MVMSADAFLQMATALLKAEECDEVHRRGAINRAYYAAYHHALQFADEHGLEVVRTNAGVHKQLTERLGASGKRLRMIADRLATLKKLRADADYKLAQSFSVRDAAKHVDGCKRLIEELERLKKEPIASSV